MTHRPGIAALAISSAVALLVACSSSGGGESARSSGVTLNGVPPGRGFMPPVNAVPAKANASGTSGATSTGTLQYYGGKVISSAQVYAIYWGNAGSYQPQLDTFLQTILPSSYFQWLGGEYQTPTQTLGAGSFVRSIVDTNVSASATVDDSQIRTELVNLVNAGTVPAPDGNNLYFFFFPTGTNVTSTDGGGASCTAFCGYHDTFTSGSEEFYYGVLPDPATCGAGCDNQGGNYFADLTAVTTHELTESITDAEVGLAIAASQQNGGTYPVFPNAWTSASGEIGDLCAWQDATVDGYNVQLEWSNVANACVSSGPAAPDDAGAGDADAAATCGACTSDQDCQLACPPVAGGGSDCCDVGSGVCYATPQPSCPVPSDAATE